MDAPARGHGLTAAHASQSTLGQPGGVFSIECDRGHTYPCDFMVSVCGAGYSDAWLGEGVDMKHRTLLICAVALAALGLVAVKMPMTPTQSISASPPATISVEELYRQVDLKSLPVLRTQDFGP